MAAKQLKTSTVLKKAKALIKRGWCKGTDAQTKTGREVEITSRSAVRFCAWGACERALGWSPHEQVIPFLMAGVPGDNIFSVANFNDAPTTTKADILGLFDLAIINAEAVGE